MIAEKLESVLKAMTRMNGAQPDENYFIMKAAMRQQKDAIEMVRQLEKVPLGETAK